MWFCAQLLQPAELFFEPGPQGGLYIGQDAVRHGRDDLLLTGLGVSVSFPALHEVLLGGIHGGREVLLDGGTQQIRQFAFHLWHFDGEGFGLFRRFGGLFFGVRLELREGGSGRSADGTGQFGGDAVDDLIRRQRVSAKKVGEELRCFGIGILQRRTEGLHLGPFGAGILCIYAAEAAEGEHYQDDELGDHFH